jgi:microcystin degradation protein MlrC
VRRKLGVVMMSDASDVVTAGAPGDSTHLLRAMLSDGGGLLTYAAVRDPVAIAAVWTRAEGNEVVDVEVGGHLDPASGPPLAVRATARAQARPSPASCAPRCWRSHTCGWWWSRARRW